MLIDGEALDSPAPVVDRLHRAWLEREPVVVELGVDASVLQVRESWDVEPHALTPRHECWRDRLAFLVWANSYDARNAALERHGRPVWWWARKALRVAPAAEVSAAGDVWDLVLPDGTRVCVDGGPRGNVVEVSAGAHTVAVWHREQVEAGSAVLERTAEPRSGLADDQLRAVRHTHGAARIIAPAGSGKTRTLTERIRHLVIDRGVDESLVCALAYNNRAAAEMRDRLRAAGCSDGVQVRTIHSLAWNLLARFAPSRPALADEREVRRRLGALCDVKPVANSDPLAPYVAALAKVRLELVAPAAVEASRDDIPGFAEVFESYTAGLRRDSMVDFDAQIYEAIRLLLCDGEARARAQAMCRHLLVDEFQDLTPAYLLLIRLLAAPALQVFAVGDDDQVLYSHAGAAPEYLIEFDTYFPYAAHLALETNYRCPPAVVDAATNLLGYNTRRVPKTIRPGRQDRDPAAVQVVIANAGQAAHEAVGHVAQLLSRGVAPGDVAVLCRVNAGLLPVVAEAKRRAIPVASPLGRGMLSRTGVRAALAYLRCAVRGPEGPWPGDAVAEVANRPSRRILTATRQRFAQHPDLGPGRMAELADRRDGERVSELAATLGRLGRRAQQRATTAELLTYIRDDVGLVSALTALDGNSGAGQSHADDLDALIDAAGSTPDPSQFGPWLEAALGGGDGDGVRLASVHRVKGLEFDHVVVLGANEPLLPHELSGDVEEERRVMHVALTRARSQVVVVAESGHDAPFLAEMTGTASSGYTREPKAPAGRGTSRTRATSGPNRAGTRSAARRRTGAPASSARPAGSPHRPLAARAATATGAAVAAVGMSVVLVDLGKGGRVVELRGDGAMVELLDGSRVIARWGSTVMAGSERVRLERPSAEEEAMRERVLHQLRRWRDTVAARDGVTPRQVGDDTVLSLVAARRPTEIGALVACYGARRSEQWGDELLVALEDADR